MRSTRASTATSAAGQAGNDDAEERDNGVDDGLQSGGNGVNNGHDAVTDRAEDGFNLKVFSESRRRSLACVNVRKRLRHPCLRLCDVRLKSVVLVIASRLCGEVDVRAGGFVVVVGDLLWNESTNKRDSLTYNKSDLLYHTDVTRPCSTHRTRRACQFPTTTPCCVTANSTCPCSLEKPAL